MRGASKRNVHFHEWREHDPRTRAPTRDSRSVCNYESTTGGSCRFHPCSSRNCARIEGPYANGGRGRGKRHEARKRVCHRANTFHRSARRVPRPRFGTTARRYPSNVGASPPVLGPCQWHRAYRARSRSNRGKPSVHEATRLARTEHGRPRSSPALRLAEPRFGGWGGGKRERPSGGGELCEPIEGPSRVSSYTRVPAASFRSVLTHINTRSVCTLTRHPPSPAVFVSSHFFSLRWPPFLFLSFSLSFFLSVPPSLLPPWFPQCPPLGRCSALLFFFFFSCSLPRRSFSSSPSLSSSSSTSFSCSSSFDTRCLLGVGSFLDLSKGFCCLPCCEEGRRLNGEIRAEVSEASDEIKRILGVRNLDEVIDARSLPLQQRYGVDDSVLSNAIHRCSEIRVDDFMANWVASSNVRASIPSEEIPIDPLVRNLISSDLDLLRVKRSFKRLFVRIRRCLCI